MTVEAVYKVIVKAVTDESFRELIFSEPEKALEGFELTQEEAAAIRSVKREEFDAVFTQLEERVSRGGLSPVQAEAYMKAGSIGDDAQRLSRNVFGPFLEF